MIQVNKWTKCYESGWKNIIVPEAFSHPAKMSYSLLKRILSHAKEQGWLNEGDVIVDPFGGIGSTGILGAYEGYQCVMVELESEFYREANSYDCPGITKQEWVRWFNRFSKSPDICPNCHQKAQSWYEKHSGIIPSRESHHYIGNFELHKDAWIEFNNPFPIILQGDSRRLCEVVEKANLIISSPPYSDSEHNYKHGLKVLGDNFKGRKAWETKGGTVEKADCIVGSPPYQGQELDYGDRPNRAAKLKDNPNFKGRKHWQNNDKTCTHYGHTNGQLGAMKPGDVDIVVGSPPFAGAHQGAVDSSSLNKGACKRPWLDKATANDGYGKTDGQLGSMKPGSVDSIISSPPYAETFNKSKHTLSGIAKRDKNIAKNFVGGYGKSKGNLGNLKSGDVDCVISSPPYEKSMRDHGEQGRELAKKVGVGNPSEQSGYSPNDDNLGNQQGDTFWQAARTIVEQCFQILKPGGHAIWVVKSFVRNKKIVDFPGDWQKLCESVGFKTVCIHHAMLVKETSHQTLFGHTEVKRKERKSFFRRLAESKGSPRIDFEVVLCMEKQPLFPMETKK